MRLALLCIALLGCSTLPITKPYHVWPYVAGTCTVRSLEKKFQAEMAKQGVLVINPVHARVVEKLSGCGDDKDTIGCTMYRPAGTRIELLKDFWDSHDCGWREALVFHEHGHADLLLDHEDGTLMDPTVDGGYACLLKDREKCLAQMANTYKVMLIFRDAEIHLLPPREHRRYGRRVPPICEGP